MKDVSTVYGETPGETIDEITEVKFVNLQYQSVE